MLEQIKEVFKDREEIPLYYIESGSRLWGIESPDSDYDVRGFHALSKNKYFDFKNYRDIIEVMDGDFDFVSYDIDKIFGLLAKSNPTVFEWIRADIIYLNNLPDWKEFQKNVVANFDFKSIFHHYISLSKGHINLMETGKKFTYKTVFYCLRGLMSAEIAAKKIVPELLINNLFNQFETENDILKIAKNSLEKKKAKTEKEEVSDNEKQLILTSIKNFVTDLESKSPESSNNREKLESVLTEYAINLKSKFYS